MMSQLIGITKYHAMDMKVCMRRKTTKVPPPAELLDELVTEILLRLPVKSLLRFKSVSKAWRAIISDPFFIRSHLQQSASRWRQNPSLLVTPHTLFHVIEGEPWPSTFSTDISFYQWQQPSSEEEESEARFVMHTDDFLEEFNSVCYFAHCDGLVVAPTNTNVYLFNPATRDAMRLPINDRNKMYQYVACLPVGLGRDPRTGRHKVVRAFYRSRDPLTGVHDMGMEVFTVGVDSDSWREITPNPLYPVAMWITPVFAKGALFWIIEKPGLDPSPRGILRLSLDDESFSVTHLPDSLDPALDESFILDEVHGELFLTAFSSSELSWRKPFNIWTLVEQDTRWEHRYTLDISGMAHPVALLPGGGAMILRASHYISRYDLQTHQIDTICELDHLTYQHDGTTEEDARSGQEIFYFNVIPYTESLVRI